MRPRRPSGCLGCPTLQLAPTPRAAARAISTRKPCTRAGALIFRFFAVHATSCFCSARVGHDSVALSFRIDAPISPSRSAEAPYAFSQVRCRPGRNTRGKLPQAAVPSHGSRSRRRLSSVSSARASVAPSGRHQTSARSPPAPAGVTSSIAAIFAALVTPNTGIERTPLEATSEPALCTRPVSALPNSHRPITRYLGSTAPAQRYNRSQQVCSGSAHDCGGGWGTVPSTSAAEICARVATTPSNTRAACSTQTE